MSVLNNSNAISAGGAYNITDSLRLRGSGVGQLTQTPSASGNRQTWTHSVWIKRGSLGTIQRFWSTDTSPNYSTYYRFTSGDAVNLNINDGTNNYGFTTTQVFRDTSAWYHLVLVLDTTNATASDRFKFYVNGARVTAFASSTNPPQNSNGQFNSNVGHRISTYNGSAEWFDGYMTEFNFVDGQALTASDFGETNADGVWSPKEYTGTYGTNGFYLPMKETTQATGFNTVLYTGTGATQSINGVGFSPDLVWIKGRNISTWNHYLMDSVRGAIKSIYSDATAAEGNYGLTSLNADGFTTTTDAGTNESGKTFVAWCWDAGSSTVSNTDGTITSSVRANPASGFSVVTYTGTGTNGATVGHGLTSAPEMIIIKNRDNGSQGWVVYHTSLGATKYLMLNTTDGEATWSGVWNNTAPTSSVFTLGTSGALNTSAQKCVAYCFSEVSGFSKFGSYTGNGSTSGPTVTTGFRPAFVLIKNATTGGLSWVINDNTRGEGKDLSPNASDAESTPSPARLTFTDTGFTLTSSANSVNQSGATHIYMAFADTRDFQWNFDASGNKNNWTPNNINSNASSETTYDLMSDTPSLADEDTSNFATLNPLDKNTSASITVTNGNLTVNTTAVNLGVRGTIGVSSGKWYWEITLSTSSGTSIFGIARSTWNQTYVGSDSSSYGYGSDGQKWFNGANAAYGATFTTGDVIGVAWDADTGTLAFYKNGVSQGNAYTGISSNLYFPAISGQTSAVSNANFGQRPFKYTPPTGYKKLNTYNLPDSSITDGSQYFSATTYTGNSSSLSITTAFSPDLVWIKRRNSASNHALFDSNRGRTYSLASNLTNAEFTTVGADKDLISFDSTGYTVGQPNQVNVNGNGETFVGWSWRGSDSAPVSNTDGTVTTTVSANTTSGFSIVTWTGTGTSSTFGHGLGTAPKVIICKNRDIATGYWHSYFGAISGMKDGFITLNTTNAFTASFYDIWGNTDPTSSVFYMGGTYMNQSGDNHVAYCFAEVEGFSKFGSYVGNGSADGAFVYTGFRPAYVMTKRSSAAGSWNILDTSRNIYNVANEDLIADGTGIYTGNDMDILSNGFKFRTSGSDNVSGSYIFMAFAEVPTKLALAR